MKINCAWCKADLGDKPGADVVSLKMCTDCLCRELCMAGIHRVAAIKNRGLRCTDCGQTYHTMQDAERDAARAMLGI